MLVGLGVQAALFGPVKYGLLPEHLAEDELVAGNGVIEATTFLSIVVGTVAGGALVLLRARHRAGRRGRRRACRCSGCSARMRDPAVAGGRSVAAHRAGICSPKRWRVLRHRRIGPRRSGCACWPVLVLDHGRHADDRVPGGGARHAARRRHGADAAAGGVRDRRRRRLDPVRAAAARRGVAAVRAVRRARHLAVLLGFRRAAASARRPRERRRGAVVVRTAGA